MIDNASVESDTAGRPAKRPYAAPRLQVHGRMQVLTASGSVVKPENRGHPNRNPRA